MSSDGWMEKPAIVIQLRAPKISRALTWFKSRSHQPKRKKSAMPAISSTTWRTSSAGVAVAQMHSPSVHRKNAIVSGSKPERSIVRISR